MYCSRFAKSLLLAFFLLMVLVSLSIADDPLMAQFTADAQSGDIPLLVNFTDTSTGEIEYRVWDFGDGSDPLYTYVSGVVQHIFTSYATFDVSLTVYEDEYTYSSSSTQVVTYAPLIACFTMNYLPGSLPLEVQFTDVSEGSPVEWAWDFGDDCTSDVQNPVHTYTEVGEYCVRLTVTNSFNDTSQTDSDMSVPDAWTPNEYGHLSGTTASGSWKVALLSAGFKSVDDGQNWHVIHKDKDQTAYSDDPFGTKPQWQDNTRLADEYKWPNGTAEDFVIVPRTQPSPDKKYPLCYTSGAKMKVLLTLEVEGATVEKCRGFEVDSDGKKKEGGFDFLETEPENGQFILECTKAFEAGKVGYFEKLSIMWEALVDGKWGKLVPSKNQCYVTKTDPLPNKAGKLFHTLGCVP